MAQFKFKYRDGTDDVISGDTLKIGDDFFTVESDGFNHCLPPAPRC